MAEEVLGGYKMLRHLVTGQTSQVWEVVEANSGRHFAMKILLKEKAKEKAQRNFLLHEAKVGKELAHPNIIRIYKVNKSPANPFFVMEFFPAGNMKLRIVRKEEDFIREHAHNFIKMGATALAFMNASGWVHRDVKPDNFLVSSGGDLRLIDFALAVRKQSDGFFARLFAKKGKAQGTRSYMSPEQIRAKPLDGRADIYSFGATCYELLTGRPPFRGNSSQELLTKHILERPVSPTNHNPDLTPEIGDLVLHMLAKKKEDRPKNFHEVLRALQQIQIYKRA